MSLSRSIFISYRRSDSIAQTERIYDRLVSEFVREHVFMDADDIPLLARWVATGIDEDKPPGKTHPNERQLCKRIRRRCQMLQNCSDINQIRTIKGFNHHRLKRELAGYDAVRVDMQFRLIF